MSDGFKLRGHEIHIIDFKWLYCDTGELVSEHWNERSCGYCGKANTKEGHDGCLGTLPGVTNACCGHGETDMAYVQFPDGSDIRGELAEEFFLQNSGEKQ